MIEMKRLFFGLAPNEEARAALSAAAAQLQCEKGRLHESGNYHLTLVFLGMTPAEAVPQLLRLARLAMREPFELTLSGEMNAFKDGTVPWAAIDPCPALFALRGRLSAMLRENGFPGGDESFTPHITIGRGVRLAAPAPSIRRVSFPVTRVTLYESLRMDDRLVYRPLNPSETP
ncbi:MAG: RNA 2',3'-cyclic phosphodiesterase [Clostridia bacterium]|nr:RNA 2',3'-cyclic phosphodiesterase [Clostridia bacterium]MBO4886001.1 RNA 2',3'-cyclic phosphodiesterase [Clostridia bacterium]